jgi:gamma-glutamylcyclotransferase (GGCT)/AIG2-like uncharacterized protein YtfP
MPEATSTYVFVYGTLRKGQANDITLLSPAPAYVGTGTTPGTLYQLGWYPGLILGGEGKVVGEVYRITPPLERHLDEIEEIYPEPTNEYFKLLIPVEVAGVLFPCIVFEINPERVAGKPLIKSGDWLARG